MRIVLWRPFVVAVTSCAASPALAHGSERGFVLLLPTGYYLVAGTLAVAASFVLVSFVPPASVARLAARRLRIGTVPDVSVVPTSLIALVLLCLLVAAGLWGSRNPLANPLPLVIWTVFWVALTLAHAVFGNLWALVNPWAGPYAIIDRLTGGALARRRLLYPAWLGYWPAIAIFFAFAWFELVYPAPDDPERLAVAVAGYWVAAFAGMLVFGYGPWTERAEFFSIFFRLVAGLSPLIIDQAHEGQRTISLALPGTKLLERDPLPPSGVLFVLLTLSAVSFDGLSRTFWWLSVGGINPLEFPGRTAVIGFNSAGLLLAFAVLATLYWTAVRLGWIMAGMTAPLRPALGAFVLAIIPISVAFHFAHYLTALLVDGQYALIAASDPFGTGADLLGLDDRHVTVSFLNTYGGVRVIWNVQTAAIVLGHVAGIVLAHGMAVRLFGDGRKAALSQLPLALLMVFYTWFGLWLLSTPVFS